MAELQYEAARRSARLFLRVRLVVSGKDHQGRRFRKVCESVVISAHGGLIYIDQEVENGAELVLTNPLTQEELECRIVFLGDAAEKGQRVGIEFLTPAPRFWGVDFGSEPASPSPGSDRIH